MTDLDEKLKKFEQEQEKIQEDLTKSNNYPQDESISFGGLSLHPSMPFEIFSDEKILLSHSIVHTVFSNESEEKDRVRRIHGQLVSEMNKRGLSHNIFDSLDNI